MPPAEPAEDGAVVLRAPNWIGDAVLALPAVSALARRFRRHAVIVMARGSVAPLFVGLDGVSEVVRAGGRGAGRLAVARRALSRSRIAVGVVFPHSMGSAAEIAVGRVEQMWGYGGTLRRLALDVALPRRWLEGRHRWEAYALLAAAAELLAGAVGDGPLVGLVAGAKHPARRWPAGRFVELASRLERGGARVVLFGAPGEEPLVAAVAAADPPPLDLSGRTPLPVLVECIRRLDVLVANDTGSMHVAAVVGTPVVALFGASSEVRTGPRGRRSEAVIHPVPCRPCLRPTCAYNHGCMRGIEVRTVLDLVESRVGAGAA